MLVGLDVIGNYLTEINVTSPTGMQEIANQTGFNAAEMIIDALEDYAYKSYSTIPSYIETNFHS